MINKYRCNISNIINGGVSRTVSRGRLDQFTCLIGYSIQYESMTGSSFISYGTNI